MNRVTHNVERAFIKMGDAAAALAYAKVQAAEDGMFVTERRVEYILDRLRYLNEDVEALFDRLDSEED